MMERTAVLSFGEAPPSLNRVATAHWRRYHTAKTYWQGVFEGLLMAEKLPRGLDVVHATAVVTFTQRRRRDEGNYRFFLEKCLGDALTNGGWLPDDTIEHFRFGACELEVGDAEETIVRLRF